MFFSHSFLTQDLKLTPLLFMMLISILPSSVFAEPRLDSDNSATLNENDVVVDTDFLKKEGLSDKDIKEFQNRIRKHLNKMDTSDNPTFLKMTNDINSDLDQIITANEDAKLAKEGKNALSEEDKKNIEENRKLRQRLKEYEQKLSE